MATWSVWIQMNNQLQDSIDMKKILLVYFALMCTIVANAQKITYSGNKVVATCEVNRMADPGGDGYYHQVPEFSYHWVCSDIYEKYTSLLKSFITGEVKVYLVWTRQKDDYGNTEKVERYLGSINLAEMRKYKSDTMFIKNSGDVRRISSAYYGYMNTLMKDRSCHSVML